MSRASEHPLLRLHGNEAGNNLVKEKSLNFDASEMARTLTDSISLSLPPIAICFTDKVPEGIRNWTGRVPWLPVLAGSGNRGVHHLPK